MVRLANYKKLEEVIDDIRKTELGQLFKFDNLGLYDFYICEECSGSILDHITVRYRGLKCECYNQQDMRIL